MFLSALALAAAVQVAPAAEMAKPFDLAPRIDGQRSALECRQRTTQARQDAIARGESLGRMPAAVLQHTVIRMVDGCPVSTRVIQYRKPR